MSVRERQIAEFEVLLKRLWPGASFPELQRHLSYGATGHYTLAAPERPDLIMWAGLSQRLGNILLQEEQEHRIHYHVLGPDEAMFVHLIDGGSLELPIARRIPSAPYKQPHWLPVTVRLGPAD